MNESYFNYKFWNDLNNPQAKKEATWRTHGYPAEPHYLISPFLQMEKNLQEAYVTGQKEPSQLLNTTQAVVPKHLVLENRCLLKKTNSYTTTEV